MSAMIAAAVLERSSSSFLMFISKELGSTDVQDKLCHVNSVFTFSAFSFWLDGVCMNSCSSFFFEFFFSSPGTSPLDSGSAVFVVPGL